MVMIGCTSVSSKCHLSRTSTCKPASALPVQLKKMAHRVHGSKFRTADDKTRVVRNVLGHGDVQFIGHRS